MKHHHFSHPQIAVFRHCWKLTTKDRELLDGFFLLKATGAQLDSHMRDQMGSFDPYTLSYGALSFSVEFLDPSKTESILGNADKFVLISCRMSTINRLYVALVLPVPSNCIPKDAKDITVSSAAALIRHSKLEV
jgi:hypothetical protein